MFVRKMPLEKIDITVDTELDEFTNAHDRACKQDAAMSVLKPIMRFVREATKMDKVNPVVAYYLRLHAVQSAMRIDVGSEDD